MGIFTLIPLRSNPSLHHYQDTFVIHVLENMLVIYNKHDMLVQTNMIVVPNNHVLNVIRDMYNRLNIPLIYNIFILHNIYNVLNKYNRVLIGSYHLYSFFVSNPSNRCFHDFGNLTVAAKFTSMLYITNFT